MVRLLFMHLKEAMHERQEERWSPLVGNWIQEEKDYKHALKSNETKVLPSRFVDESCKLGSDTETD